MPASPPTVSPSPVRVPIVSPKTGTATNHLAIWFEQMLARVGGATGRPIVGDLAAFEVDVNQSDVASGASKTVLDALARETWKVREIILSGGGTNFSGGDRLLQITDGTSIWTAIPAATLQSLAAARWGDAGVPFPAAAAHMTASSGSGADIVAEYSGGATDYTAGVCTLVILAERMT